MFLSFFSSKLYNCMTELGDEGKRKRRAEMVKVEGASCIEIYTLNYVKSSTLRSETEGLAVEE